MGMFRSVYFDFQPNSQGQPLWHKTDLLCIFWSTYYNGFPSHSSKNVQSGAPPTFPANYPSSVCFSNTNILSAAPPTFHLIFQDCPIRSPTHFSWRISVKRTCWRRNEVLGRLHLGIMGRSSKRLRFFWNWNIALVWRHVSPERRELWTSSVGSISWRIILVLYQELFYCPKWLWKYNHFYHECGPNTLKALYISKVRPRLEYTVPVWGPHLKTT